MRIVGKKTERKTNISLFPADIHTYKLTFVSFFCFFWHISLNLGWIRAGGGQAGGKAERDYHQD